MSACSAGATPSALCAATVLSHPMTSPSATAAAPLRQAAASLLQGRSSSYRQSVCMLLLVLTGICSAAGSSTRGTLVLLSRASAHRQASVHHREPLTESCRWHRASLGIGCCSKSCHIRKTSWTVSLAAVQFVSGLVCYRTCGSASSAATSAVEGITPSMLWHTGERHSTAMPWTWRHRG